MATYKFSRPWNFGSELVTSVEVKEQFTAGDVRKLKNFKMVPDGVFPEGPNKGKTRMVPEKMGDYLITLVQVGTGYTAAQADLIPAEDFDDLAQMCAGFIQGGK